MTARQHAAYQLQGGRTEQCDAAATRALPDGGRVHVLLDGIGSTPEVRDWTRAQARRLAGLGAKLGDAHAAITRLQDEIAAEPGRTDRYAAHQYACAAIAIHIGVELRVAWCGDVRAYLNADNRTQLLTHDHNMRQVLRDAGHEPHPSTRNEVTQHLGYWGHDDAAIGQVTVPAVGRLLLASDGAYEPLDDNGEDLGHLIAGNTPLRMARDLVRLALRYGGPRADNATVLIADLTAED